MQVWVDDRLVPEEQARVSVLDHGFLVGDGVFESVKVLDGAAFALTRHLRRLFASAAGLGLSAPEESRVRQAVVATLQANPLPGPGKLRITWTSGNGPLGSDRVDAPGTLVVAVAALGPVPDSVAALTVPWPRNERGALAGLKTTSYAENAIALAHARARGAAEAIFTDGSGRVCEGTGSNVFAVLGGRVLTPTLRTGALAGVTRALVLEWTEAEEADFGPAELARAEEVFLTSTTREVQAVHALDGRELPAPGPRTRGIAAEFARRAAAGLDP